MSDCNMRCETCSKYDCGVDPCACPDHQKPANQGRGFDALVAYEAAKLERSEAYWAGHSDEGETMPRTSKDARWDTAVDWLLNNVDPDDFVKPFWAYVDGEIEELPK